MSNTFVQLLPILAIVVLLYLVLIRPQQRRQRRMTDVRRNLRAGQRVMTNAGLLATVSVVEDEHVVLEVAPGVECRYVKASVAQVVEDPETESDEPSDVVADEATSETDEPSAEPAPTERPSPAGPKKRRSSSA